jgi:G3E family GTPase
MAPIPITLITGFLGSGKTTLLLNLIPQLKAINPDYQLALLKNEFGDLAIDSQLASTNAISGVREMLNGCICCNLVGDVKPALEELRETIPGLDRVVIETSGSAFPATLAMEVNRLARETGGAYVLDGVVSVIDVENWEGYEDTSYTAKLQARYTDLVVFNKWELCDERRFDECLDRLGDLEGVDTAWVKSDKGRVPQDVIFGIDGGLAGELNECAAGCGHDHSNGANGHTHEHQSGHQSEVEVLSVTLHSDKEGASVDTDKLQRLLSTAQKDEVYRMKAVFTGNKPLSGSDTDVVNGDATASSRYILNWAFGRWTVTPIAAEAQEHESSDGVVLRMTLILARYESTKWKKRIETSDFIALDGTSKGELTVEKIA